MTTATKPAPKPTTETPELTAGERLAAALRVLADIATTPSAADGAYEDVLVVLPITSRNGQDELAAVLADRGAVEQPARDSGSPLYSRHFTERTWLLPGGAVRLSTSSYVPVEDIEAADR
jgi:hypothetical protein